MLLELSFEQAILYGNNSSSKVIETDLQYFCCTHTYVYENMSAQRKNALENEVQTTGTLWRLTERNDR